MSSKRAIGYTARVALATVVGVLIEASLMLALVRIANRSQHRLATD